MRKPHEQWQRLLRFMLVGLGCFLVPQFGPGQLPTVENRTPIALGPPQEQRAPQVLEFTPTPPPKPNVVVFEPSVPPPKPSIVVFKPPQPMPPISSVRGFVLTPPLQETEAPPEFDRIPFAGYQRPMFGAVAGLDPLQSPAHLTPALWTSEPPNFVRFLPIGDRVVNPIADELPPQTEQPPSVWQTELDATLLARLLRQARAREYMDRLGSSDGTPHFLPRYPNNFVPARHPLEPSRRVHPGLYETITWPVRCLAQPFRCYD